MAPLSIWLMLLWVAAAFAIDAPSVTVKENGDLTVTVDEGAKVFINGEQVLLMSEFEAFRKEMLSLIQQKSYESGTLIFSSTTHNNTYLEACTFTPNSLHIAVGGPVGGFLTIYDLDGNIVQQITDEGADRINAIAFSADGKVMAFGGQDAKVHVYAHDGQLWTLVHVFDDASSFIADVAVTDDGKHVVAAEHGAEAIVFDIDAKTVAYRFPHHTSVVSGVAIDGTRVVTTSWDSTAYVWELLTGQVYGNFSETSGFLYHPTFSPTDPNVIGYLHATRLRFYSMITGEQVEVPSVSIRDSYALNGRQLAFGSRDENDFKVSITDMDDEDVSVALYEGPTDRSDDMMISPDGQFLTACGRDGVARVWKL